MINLTHHGKWNQFLRCRICIVSALLFYGSLALWFGFFLLLFTFLAHTEVLK